MFCTTECWDCEDRKCEHYISKTELYFENQRLKDQLQQKENIIKEVREYIEEHTENVEMNIYGMPPVIRAFRGNTQTLLEIIDKENKNG